LDQEQRFGESYRDEVASVLTICPQIVVCGSTVDPGRKLPVNFSWLRGCSRFRRRWIACRLDLAWSSLGIVCARFWSLSTPKQIAQ
jgi:hypothetical protein